MSEDLHPFFNEGVRMMEEIQIQQDAERQVKMSYYRKRYRLLIEQGFVNDKRLLECIKDIEELEKRSGKKDSDLVFITISPRPDVDFQDFLSVVNRLFSKVWLRDYIYVFEQRGDNEDNIGKGFHLHGLLYRNGKKFSEVRREVISTIKKVVDINVFSAYEVKLVKDDDDNVKKILNYMLGEKADDYKHPKQVMDRVWREKNNILSYYSKGDGFQQRV